MMKNQLPDIDDYFLRIQDMELQERIAWENDEKIKKNSNFKVNDVVTLNNKMYFIKEIIVLDHSRAFYYLDNDSGPWADDELIKISKKKFNRKKLNL